MSTVFYHPDELVLPMAAVVLLDARHQRDLYVERGGHPARVHQYLQDTGYISEANAFLAANARAYSVAYREEVFTLEWTPAQSAAVARLVRLDGLSVEDLGRAMITTRLFRYNLDGEATVDALHFVLRVALAVGQLAARPDVLRAAGV